MDRDKQQNKAQLALNSMENSTMMVKAIMGTKDITAIMERGRNVAKTNKKREGRVVANVAKASVRTQAIGTNS
jgi:hypothetical protein